MNFIYKLLNIKIINLYLTKLSEKIYKYLRKSSKENKLDLFRQIIESIHKTSYYKNKSKPLMWDTFYPDHNLCTQQKIVQQIGFMKLLIPFIYFLSNKKKIIFILSNRWINKLKENKIDVNSFWSRILNYLYFIHFFFEGLIYFFSILYKYFYFNFTFKHFENFNFNKNIKIFANVNFNEEEILRNSKFDLIYWINETFKHDKNIFFINKKIKKKIKDDIFCIPDPLFFYIKKLNIFKFTINFFIIFFSVIVDIFFLKFSNLILFKEKIEASIINCSSLNKQINFYFIFTQNIKRPLWTYEILKKNSTVSVVCLNIFTDMKINDDKNYSPDIDAYHLCSWDNYFIWTDNCEKFLINRLIKNSSFKKDRPNFNKIGIIYFKDSNKNLNFPKKRKIALFTYERHKFSPGIGTMAEWQYKNPKLLWDFYNTIINIADELGIQIIIKRKRNLKQNISIRRIEGLFNKLKKNKNVLIIDSDHSAYKLLLECDATISQPFTSVGYAAKKLNKPSVYFDPTKELKSDDLSANGVKLINDKVLLKKWIVDNVQK